MRISTLTVRRIHLSFQLRPTAIGNTEPRIVILHDRINVGGMTVRREPRLDAENFVTISSTAYSYPVAVFERQAWQVLETRLELSSDRGYIAPLTHRQPDKSGCRDGAVVKQTARFDSVSVNRISALSTRTLE